MCSCVLAYLNPKSGPISRVVLAYLKFISAIVTFVLRNIWTPITLAIVVITNSLQVSIYMLGRSCDLTKSQATHDRSLVLKQSTALWPMPPRWYGYISCFMSSAFQSGKICRCFVTMKLPSSLQ